MSTPLPTKEAAEQAYSYMVDEIHVPAFFEKLASHGIKPNTDEEAAQLLELGAVLAQAEAAGQVKQAQEQGEGNPFLNHVLDRLRPQQTPDIGAAVKQAAAQLASTSDLAKTAALVYAHAASGGELADDEPAEEAQSE